MSAQCFRKNNSARDAASEAGGVTRTILFGRGKAQK
jgi:hypothetical protein